MPRWTIRAKLILGLVLVVGMNLILLGGSIYGLRAFHDSNLTLVDQLRELGGSKLLLEQVVPLENLQAETPKQREVLEKQVMRAREALEGYFQQLKDNFSRGKRADDGRDELEVAFLIDDDLAGLLAELHPEADPPPAPLLPGASRYLTRRQDRKDAGELNDPDDNAFDQAVAAGLPTIPARVERLGRRVLKLPNILFFDFYVVLQASQTKYLSSKTIVLTSALMVTVLLCALAVLVSRWVLHPVRILQRGVQRLARGAFDCRIMLETGDEMQTLAETFNDMAAKIRVTYQDLEHQVQVRSKQLARSERLAGVGFLAAGVAHEINNPLASIAFCSEALERRLGDVLGQPLEYGHPPRGANGNGHSQGQAKKAGLNRIDTNGDSFEKVEASSGEIEVARNYIRMIQEEAFRCKRITEKLLDFSRSSDIKREPTDLAALVQDVTEMIRHIGKYRNKTIAFQPKNAIMVYADSQEIKQVALNLIVNALDSMEHGGVLRIDLRSAEYKAEMVLQDEGHGMTPEVLENIFEPFFTTRKSGKGTGLGLSITHRIVAQHDGEIYASSEGEGKGSTFIVRLPLASTGLSSVTNSG